ncbi:hypothetical protein AB7849_05035 [Rhodanobacter sp. 115]|uniref:hypothetical protein n=1 Tax=Rhodanobacter sp. FW021-MT20 TaxID=1162282 RepID=UPI000260CE85|nr:hypothetical protein [Rhodanobacter sp. 115]EIL88674.1 hypothetical protein UU5_16924 [Rhodanobacter sp. 115]
MSVKAFLAKEDGDFVSLDEVLRGMMRANDCSYQEAAITILRLLAREDFPPTFLSMSRVYGVREDVRGREFVMDLLRVAAIHGEPADESEIPF